MSPSPAPPRVVVHLVHGTWPYGLGVALFRRGCLGRWLTTRRCREGILRTRFWFQPGSGFRKELRTRLGCDVTFVKFGWSGANSFRARDEAARALREHLIRYQQRWPETRHLVVAHSHGGTVAVDALRDPDLGLPMPVAGLLTMATPFVKLQGSLQREDFLRVLAAALSPLSLIVVLISAMIAQAMPGAFLSNFAGNTLLGLLLVVLGLGCLFALLGESWFDRHIGPRLERLFTAGTGRPTVTRLPCPLMAIRAPGDEASLAITSAQVVEQLALHTWGAIGPRLSQRILQWNRSARPFWQFLLAFVLISSSGFALWWRWWQGQLPGPLLALIGGWYLGCICVAVPLLTLLIAPLILLLPGLLALAVACGPEVLRYPGALTVYAEPVPQGVRTEVLMMTLTDDERRGLGLVHSIHELSATRARVAAWIAETTLA